MPEYQAPLKDMQFVLKELAGLEAICDQSGDDVDLDTIEAVLEEAGKIAAEVLSPLNRVGDLNPAQLQGNQVIESKGFAEAYRQFVEGGWPALSCAEAYGGMGMPELVAAAASEMWASANMAFSLTPMLTAGAISALTAHASDDLKQRYLPKLISGEWTGTMNLTEPQAGSDLGVVRTKAVSNGDHYLISGSKIFITWGDHQMTDNIVHLVLARTPDAPEGVKGISMFIVPKFLVNEDGSCGEQNDVYPTALEHKMGIHGSPTCVMNYGDNGGAVGYLVGEENHGLIYMFVMMNLARLHVGIEGVAISERAYQDAVDYAKQRIQGSPLGGGERTAIINHPDVRRMLVQMRALTEASRAISYVASSEIDKQHRGDKKALARVNYLTPIAKAWATEMAQEVTYLAVQVYGGMGYVEESGVAQYMRDARITTIYEGTTGIQAMDLIGRKLVHDKSESLTLLLDEIAEDLKTMPEESSTAAIRGAVKENLSLLQESAAWIVEQSAKNIQTQGLAAHHFLMLNGTVFGGYYLAKSASVAAQKMDEDKLFYTAKLSTAQFYAEQIMPRAGYHAAALRSDVDTLMSTDIEQF